MYNKMMFLQNKWYKATLQRKHKSIGQMLLKEQHNGKSQFIIKLSNKNLNETEPNLICFEAAIPYNCFICFFKSKNPQKTVWLSPLTLNEMKEFCMKRKIPFNMDINSNVDGYICFCFDNYGGFYSRKCSYLDDIERYLKNIPEGQNVCYRFHPKRRNRPEISADKNNSVPENVLYKECKAIVVQHSSIGITACFYGIPIIMFDDIPDSIYNDLAIRDVSKLNDVAFMEDYNKRRLQFLCQLTKHLVPYVNGKISHLVNEYIKLNSI